MIPWLLMLIILLSTSLLGFACLYKSVPIAILNICALLLIGPFLQPWLVYSPPLTIEDVPSWRRLLLVWFLYLLAAIVATVVIHLINKRRQKRGRHPF